MTDLTHLKQDFPRLYHNMLGAPVKEDKKNWHYHVPWRQDNSPSLLIRKSDGVWSDFARDEHGDVLECIQRVFRLEHFSDVISKAHDLQGTSEPVKLPEPPRQPRFPIPADAPTPPPHPTLNEPAMKWPYKDRSGNTIFYICRFESDTKKIPIPLAYYDKTGWEYALRIEWYPLFGLELLAKYPNREILLVEGEKAALAGRLIFPDMIVMCWHGGTSRVTQADFTCLRNRTVTLWPDNDEPGKQAMEKVKEILQSADVQVAELFTVRIPTTFPQKWDLADEIPEGADLQNIIDRRVRTGKARLNPMSSTLLAKKKYNPMQWVVEGLIPEGLSLLSAPGKIGKTFFCQELALCLATGRPFLGIDLKPGRVLYVDGEQNYRVNQKRLKDLGWDNGADNLDIFCEPGFQLDEYGLEELGNYVDKHHGRVRAVFLDTLERLIPQPDRRGLDAYQTAVARVSPLQEWVQRYNVPVIVVHHTKKGVTEGGEAYDDASGSRGITGTFETLLTFKRVKGDYFKLSVISRYGVAKDIAMTRSGVHWEMQGDFEQTQIGNERQEILDLLKENGRMGPSAIAVELNKNKGTISRQLRKMASVGLVQYLDGGHYEIPSNCGTIVVDGGETDMV